MANVSTPKDLTPVNATLAMPSLGEASVKMRMSAETLARAQTVYVSTLWARSFAKPVARGSGLSMTDVWM